MENLVKSNLNWSVKSEKIMTESGLIIPEKICLIREDTNEILGVHGEGYTPFQNSELLELLESVSQKTGLPLHKGGSFGNGKKVYIQLKSDNLIIRNVGGQNDLIEGYVSGINSFDGSTSLSFGTSTKTISCSNTFWGVYKDLESKVRHTKNMGIKIDLICKRIDNVLHDEKIMFDNIVKMSETDISKNLIDNVKKTLFDIDKKVNIQDPKEIEKLSTNIKNKLNKFEYDLNGELNVKGQNLWGLFSGVTKYTTHSISKEDNSERKMFGLYGNRERKIYSDLVELV